MSLVLDEMIRSDMSEAGTDVLRVLQVEDYEGDAALVRRTLERSGYRVNARRVQDAEEMAQALSEDDWDVIIADYCVPEFDAPDALAVLKRSGRDIPFIIVSGTVGEAAAVEMMRAGAHDYILKDNLARLTPAVEREINEARLRGNQSRQEVALLDALRRREKELERSNADLQAYVYTVSHDLQEPLRMISTYIDLVVRSLGPQANERSLEHMSVVRNGALRMQRMLEDLLQFSRAGQDDHEMCPVDCSGIAAHVLELMSMKIRASGATVSVGPLPAVLSWPGRLDQVFQNLIGNALKYQRPNVAPVIEISASLDEDTWIFTVKDNGIGFDGKYAERIFGLFRRLHPAGEYEGTGIGLAIARRIVERHGGRIWAESAVGEGSAFHFTVPTRLA